MLMCNCVCVCYCVCVCVCVSVSVCVCVCGIRGIRKSVCVCGINKSVCVCHLNVGSVSAPTLSLQNQQRSHFLPCAGGEKGDRKRGEKERRSGKKEEKKKGNINAGEDERMRG